MTIVLTEKEEKQAQDWIENHQCGPIFVKDPHVHFQVSYIITPTNIGYITEVRCNKCNQVHDVTDYDVW